MRVMKDSGVYWIGSIPKNWLLLPTKRFFRTEKRIVGDSDNEYERLALTMQGVIKRSKDDSEGLQPEKFEGYQILRENELVFKLIDLENVKTSRVGLSPYTGLVSPAYIVMTNDHKDNRFFYYWFMFMYYNEVFNQLGGTGVRSALNAKDVCNLPVPSIDYEEQSRIADYLDSKCSKIDSIIEKQKQIIEKLKEYKTSLITEVVTKGLDPNVEMKDSGVEWIGKIPKHWFITQLKRFCYFKTGTTPKTSNPLWFDGSLKWYTPMDFSDNYVLGDSSRTLTYRAKQDNVATIIPKNTVIIIGIGGTAGKIGLTLEECSCNQQLTAIISQKIHHKYLMYWMIANSRFLKETALYTTLPIINNRTLADYLLIFPKDAQEQLKISDYLDLKCLQIDKTISDRQIAIEKLQEYKKSLIYEVVTGKREV